MTTESIPDQLRSELEQIDRPGSFCVSGSVSPILPGLTIDDVGVIAFPLATAQAKLIKKVCEQAPYGKGEATVVDTKVRKVWQLMPNHFKLTNLAWKKFLEQTLTTVRDELGLQNEELDCLLYNLLLYEKGSFFLPHRDGEKADRMVATLVIVLPSAYEGGELIIRHDGKEETIDFTTVENGEFMLHFAAFYADCEHEIRPLKSGYRLCLVYNVTLAKSKNRITAPSASSHIESVANILKSWVQTGEEKFPEKMVITLDHQYTQDGLTWDMLKGIDRAQADIVREAARQSGCRAHLAIVTLHESGSAEPREQSRRRYYAQDSENPSDYEMGEVFETDLRAEHWIDDAEKRVEIGSLRVEEFELLWPDWLTDVTPEIEFEGYTGNAGMTLDHWYRRAAIFLWSIDDHYAMICKGSLSRAIDMLAELVKAWKKSAKSKQAAAKNECIALASQIALHWGYVGSRRDGPNIFTLLEELDELKLFQSFLQFAFPRDRDMIVPLAFLEQCEKHGWDSFTETLTEMIGETTVQTATHNIQFIGQIALLKRGKQSQRIQLLRKLLTSFIATLTGWETNIEVSADWQFKRMERGKILVGVVRALSAVRDPKLTNEFLTHMRALPERYPMFPMQIVALGELQPVLKEPYPELVPWLTACRQALEAMTVAEPTEPTDLSRPAPIVCRCNECNLVNEFLRNPTQNEHRVRAVEYTRSHVGERIRQFQCDLAGATEKKGSPYTLVLTKTDASFQCALAKYHEDMKDLNMIKAIEAKVAGE